MQEWKRIPHAEIHRIGWRNVIVKKFIMPNGSIEEYGILDKDGAAYVGVIALTPSNMVVVARQFRPGPEIIMDELPGGGVEADETPEQAALRELVEETGYKPKKIELLGIVRKEAYRNAIHHFFIAYDCKKELEPSLEENEFIEPHEITIGQLLENALAAKMTDTSGVLLAIDKLRNLQK